MRWFRLTIPARGRKIESRRRVRVWLKDVEAVMAREFPTVRDVLDGVWDAAGDQLRRGR